jgi:hypothetical protein
MPRPRQNICKGFRHLLTEDKYEQEPRDLRICEASGFAGGRAPVNFLRHLLKEDRCTQKPETLRICEALGLDAR